MRCSSGLWYDPLVNDLVAILFTERKVSQHSFNRHTYKLTYTQWQIKTFGKGGLHHVTDLDSWLWWGKKFNMFPSISHLFLHWRGRPKSIAKLYGGHGRICSTWIRRWITRINKQTYMYILVLRDFYA